LQFTGLAAELRVHFEQKYLESITILHYIRLTAFFLGQPG